MAPDAAFWKHRTVCVTGGTGFLGHHLVRQLCELGSRVRVLALRPGPSHPLFRLGGVSGHFGDIRDRHTVRQALAGCDVVFHTAGIVAVWGEALHRMHEVHVEGTRRVLEEAPAHARVVHTSSIVTVGASRTGGVLDEDSPFQLDRLAVGYVQAKRAAELLALEAARQGRDVVVTNPGYLLGPEDHERSVMGRFCVRFWKGRMPLAPPGGLNLVDVRDVARGHLLAAERGQAGRRYILGGENHSLRQFMRMLAEAAGLRPRWLPALPCWALTGLAGLAEGYARLAGREPYPSFQHVRLNRYCWFGRSDRSRRELGYHSRPLRECLADTYRWYQDGGKLSCRGLNRWWMRPARPVRKAA